MSPPTIYHHNPLLEYLGISLYSNLKHIHHDYATTIVDNWTKPLDYSSCIKYNSLLTFPIAYNRKGINKEYFDEIKHTLLTNKLWLDDTSNLDLKILPHFKSSQQSKHIVAKKDNVYNFWTLFDYQTMSKTRVVVNESGEQIVTPNKSSTPDVVNVKLNDCCCNTSTPCKHVELYIIKQHISIMGSHQVLEIHFKEKEPTLHPNIIELLQYSLDQHIIPTITTKNMEWVNYNIGNVKNIISNCMFLVSSGKDINRLATIIQFYELPMYKIQAHLIIGTVYDYTFREIVQLCDYLDIPLTLLGVDRSTSYIDIYWYDILLDMYDNNDISCEIGMDTLLVNQSVEVFKDEELPVWLYHINEHTFSWYVDVIDNQMGPTHYNTEQYKHFPLEFVRKYAEMGGSL